MQNILLLHGALGADADLAPLAAALTGKGFTVHSFSFSGHGQIPFADGFGIETFAAELKQFIEHKKLRQPDVFGYSMGGFVALYLASQQPALIGSIATLGTKFNWSTEAVEKETAGLDPAWMLEKIPAFARSLELKHGTAWKGLLARTADLMREINAKQFLSPEVLKTITTPVLLGLGDRDKMVTLEETTAVYKILPKAAMYMLPDTKHPIEAANTKLLAELLASR